MAYDEDLRLCLWFGWVKHQTMVAPSVQWATQSLQCPQTPVRLASDASMEVSRRRGSGPELIQHGLYHVLLEQRGMPLITDDALRINQQCVWNGCHADLLGHPVLSVDG